MDFQNAVHLFHRQATGVIDNLFRPYSEKALESRIKHNLCEASRQTSEYHTPQGN